jgi:hypothetical protein
MTMIIDLQPGDRFLYEDTPFILTTEQGWKWRTACNLITRQLNRFDANNVVVVVSKEKEAKV